MSADGKSEGRCDDRVLGCIWKSRIYKWQITECAVGHALDMKDKLCYCIVRNGEVMERRVSIWNVSR